MVVAATDGSSRGNPGASGWAWVTADGRMDSAGARHSTNNRMELRAVEELLRAIDRSEPLHVLSDSQYVIDIFTKWLPGWRQRGWRTAGKKDVANRDLIERIDSLLQDRDVTFEWVKGHAGHALNEQADTLARNAAQMADARLDREYYQQQAGADQA